MSNTPKLSLPFLAPGQAQKEFFHNEALQTLDILVAAVVEEPPRNSPPTTPADGAAYIVDTAPVGAWLGKAGCIAAFSSGGWRFVAPFDGLSAYIRSSQVRAVYESSAWQQGVVRAAELLIAGLKVVGGRAAPIAAPSGGTTIDAQARTSVGQILDALRQHGLIET